MINYKPVDKKRKKELYTIMATGNNALVQCSETLGFSNAKDFRKFLFRHDLSIKSMAKEIAINGTDRKLLEKSLPKIRAVRNVEIEVLEGWCNTVRDVAGKMYKVGNDDLDNYTQEGYMALLDCMYGYKDEDVEFTTFLYRSVKNRLMTTIRNDRTMSPVSRDAMELKHQFDNMKKTVNGPCTDEMVFEMLEWSDDKRKLYVDAVAAPMHASVLSESAGADEENYDYTQFRVNSDEVEDQDFLAIEKIREALSKANLSRMERIVVEGSMQPYYGWQTKIAESNINPDTGKPYSRRAIGYMLDNALSKIKAACNLRAA